MLHEADEKLYSRLGLEKPSHSPHITEEELQKKFEELKLNTHHQWHQSGREIYCDCEVGHHASYIPTNKLLIGTDQKGLPIFRDIVV